MLFRAAALILLGSTLAWSQASTVPAGCANLPRTAQTNPDDNPDQKEKVGLKKRLKDQFSGGCANLFVTHCWGDEAPQTPNVPGVPEDKNPTQAQSTTSQQPPQPAAQQPPAPDTAKKSDPLAFPEDQSRRAEDAAHGVSSSSSSSKKNDPLAFPEQESQRAQDAAQGVSSSAHPQPLQQPNPGEMEVVPMQPYNPHQADKDVEVGDFYYKRENYKAAVSRYEEALQLRPGSPSTTFKLADASEKDKKLEEAAVYYSEYVRQYPNGKQIKQAREALERLAPVVRADAAHLKLVEISHDLQAGERLLAQKNFTQATQRFCDVAGVAPDNARAFFRLAQSQEASGDFSSAYQNYQSYLKLAPDGPFADAARRQIARLAPQVQQGAVTSPSSEIRR